MTENPAAFCSNPGTLLLVVLVVCFGCTTATTSGSGNPAVQAPQQQQQQQSKQPQPQRQLPAIYNSRGIPYPEFRFTPWSTLDAQLQADATEVLGYDEVSWNVVGQNFLELFGYDSIATLSTADQGPKSQLDVLIEIGFTPDYAESWDCYMNHYYHFQWDELPDEIRGYYEILGYNNASYAQEAMPPASTSVTWEELSPDEQVAAGELCFMPETWRGQDDALSLELWGPFVVEVEEGEGDDETTSTIITTSAPTTAPATTPTTTTTTTTPETASQNNTATASSSTTTSTPGNNETNPPSPVSSSTTTSGSAVPRTTLCRWSSWVAATALLILWS